MLMVVQLSAAAAIASDPPKTASEADDKTKVSQYLW